LLLAVACRDENAAATKGAPSAPRTAASAAAPRPSASAARSERELFDLKYSRQTTRALPSPLLAPVRVRGLAVGNGWGCAALAVSMSENVMQCWALSVDENPRPDTKISKTVDAKLVPWLPPSAFAAGDRLCACEDGRDRCWPALEFLAVRPAGLPDVWTWPASKSLVVTPSVGDVTADFFQCSFAERAECRGRSRDGFFGTGAACSDETKRAWPGEHGPVAVPGAACADAPTAVPGLARVRGISSWSAGPRGVCATDFDGTSRCVGAIARPPRGTKDIAVGTGDEPNACGVLGESLVCWGGRYSPASAPNRFVRIAFEKPAASGAPVVDSGGRADKGCQVHRPCLRPFRSLAACRSGDGAPPWSEVVREEERLRGKSVRVAGRLFVGSGSGTMVGCGWLDARGEDPDQPPPCCNSSYYPLVVISDGRVLRVDGLDCHGDESRACCNLPASGERVIASGTLEPEEREPPGWVLRRPELCVAPD
jgi:hypothetical protein